MFRDFINITNLEFILMLSQPRRFSLSKVMKTIKRFERQW